MRGDPAGAAAFSEVLIATNDGVGNGEIPTGKVSVGGNLPFYFLCCPVLSFLDAVQMDFPHKYADS